MSSPELMGPRAVLPQRQAMPCPLSSELASTQVSLALTWAVHTTAEETELRQGFQSRPKQGSEQY